MRNNATWMPMDVVTVIDVLESGACYAGVSDYIATTRVIAGPPVDVSGTDSRLAKVARRDGYGDGSGSGYGSGDGDGDGDGDGYGDGYGSGSGSGYGDGDGDGDGDGSGYGYGDGSGDGSGVL